MRFDWLDEKIPEMIKKYNEGLSPRDIASYYNVSSHTIYNRLKGRVKMRGNNNKKPNPNDKRKRIIFKNKKDQARYICTFLRKQLIELLCEVAENKEKNKKTRVN